MGLAKHILIYLVSKKSFDDTKRNLLEVLHYKAPHLPTDICSTVETDFIEASCVRSFSCFSLRPCSTSSVFANCLSCNEALKASTSSSVLLRFLGVIRTTLVAGVKITLFFFFFLRHLQRTDISSITEGIKHMKSETLWHSTALYVFFSHESFQ